MASFSARSEVNTAKGRACLYVYLYIIHVRQTCGLFTLNRCKLRLAFKLFYSRGQMAHWFCFTDKIHVADRSNFNSFLLGLLPSFQDKRLVEWGTRRQFSYTNYKPILVIHIHVYIHHRAKALDVYKWHHRESIHVRWHRYKALYNLYRAIAIEHFHLQRQPVSFIDTNCVNTDISSIS